MSTLALYPRSLGNRANRVEGAATKEQGACSKDRGWGALGSMGEYSNNQTISLIVIDFVGKTIEPSRIYHNHGEGPYLLV